MSSTFSDLKDKIEAQLDDVEVTILCSDLDCCEEDSWCSSQYYCDTDGDGVIDTSSGTNGGSGGGGTTASDAMQSYKLSFVCLIALIVATLV